jgi:hypothetical protein
VRPGKAKNAVIHYNFESSRQNMPPVRRGGLVTLGIYPTPDHEDLSQAQAAYVTLIKRHFDAICVAEVFLKWNDEQLFLLCVHNQTRPPPWKKTL